MGGLDKAALPVGGVPMRERVLAEVADASPRILVGPGPAPPGVRLTREVPAGGGPVAAIAAGLALLDADVPAVALLAADLPLLTRSAVGKLLHHLGKRSTGTLGERQTGTLGEPPTGALGDSSAGTPIEPSADALGEPPADALGEPPTDALGGPPADALGGPPTGAVGALDGVCFVDRDGRRQTLCGVWRPDALRAGLHRLAVERGGELAGAPLRELLAGLVVHEVTWSGAGPPPWFDCDTERDVRRAEEWMR